MTLKTRLKVPFTLHSSCAHSVEDLVCTLYMSKLITRFALLACSCFAYSIVEDCPKWVLQPKKIAAQFFLGKYLQIRGGDLNSPRF